MEEIRIERWGSEIPLAILVTLASIFIWVMLAISMIGMIYVVMFGLFFMITHFGFIAYVRGSAMRISPDQFPELFHRIENLSRRVGLSHTPDAYLLQADGALNALATKLFASNLIVLYSDLVEACEENEAALDMIVAHELGHIKAGHLRFMWFLLPGMMIPFLGTAYSRAREFTCDRYGFAGAGGGDGALRGLAILSAGATQGPKMNLVAFVKQRDSLNTGTMTLGKWFSTHPPLSERILALEPSLYPQAPSQIKGAVMALASIGLFFMIPMIAGGIILSSDGFRKLITDIAKANENIPGGEIDPNASTASVENDIDKILSMAAEYQESRGLWPGGDTTTLVPAWNELRPGTVIPYDPYDGLLYGYYFDDTSFTVFSSGKDTQPWTDDDVSMVIYSTNK